MGNKDQRHPGLLAQFRQQLHDLRLNCHIQGSRRFVRYQHIGASAIAMAIMMRWLMPPENS